MKSSELSLDATSDAKEPLIATGDVEEETQDSRRT
jgi:hypothetical protein